MQKICFYPALCSLFFMLAFITSCNGQADANTSGSNQSAVEAAPKTGAQIAEYVVALWEDKKGTLWFGTIGKGVARYDGKSLSYFSTEDGLGGSTVVSMAEDDAGNLWLGTHDDLSKYDGKTFMQYPGVEGLSGNDIYSIYEDRAGHIWIGATGVGAYRYNGNTFTVFKETDRKDLTVHFGVQAILEDKNGTLWFGFSGGLFRFYGTSFTNVTQDGPWK